MSSYDPIAEDRRLARRAAQRPPLVTIRPGVLGTSMPIVAHASLGLGRDVPTAFEPLGPGSSEWQATAAAMGEAAGRAALVAAVYARQRS